MAESMTEPSRGFGEGELIPLSGLQHLLYCERQFALIHVEQLWDDNVFTVQGTQLHKLVERRQTELRRGIRIARAVPVRSSRLGVSGRADAIELRPDPSGIAIPGLSGHWSLYPVEYKRGRPKQHRADDVQLCAQALCLEEMLAADVPRGALFYGAVRRRKEVEFDSELRSIVEHAAMRAHELFDKRQTPSARRDSRCDRCSLLQLCQPTAVSRSAQRYILNHLNPAADAGQERSGP